MVRMTPFTDQELKRYLETGERLGKAGALDRRCFELLHPFVFPCSYLRTIHDALALYFVFYSFVKIHKTLRVNPAMQAGLTDQVWEWEDVLTIIDTRNPAPKKRGPYKKRNSN